MGHVEIPDARLAVALRLSPGEPILEKNLKEREQLQAMYMGIRDLTGIEKMTSLKRLWLYSNDEIVDITPLTGLTQLTYLSLSGNAISDITPLANLTQLKSLWLDGNEISDITPLANLTQLESLWLHSNEISDVSIVENFKRLKNLSIKGNPIQNFTPIRRLREQIPKLKLDTQLSS